MRRTGGYAPHGAQNSYEMVEEENEQMTSSLFSKVKELKTLSINIGDEVKYQNKMLNEMDDEFDQTGSFLSGSMSMLKKLTKKGHQKNLCYVILFCFVVMMLTWFFVRFLR